MKVEELRNKSEIELRQELLALLKELFGLKMQKGLGQLAKPQLIKNVKLSVARVKTILKEKGCKV